MSAGKRMFTVQSRIQIILSTLAVTAIHTFVSLGNCAVSAVCVLVGKYSYVKFCEKRDILVNCIFYQHIV